MASNDPRDYILNAGSMASQSIADYKAKQEHDAELDKPLPDFLQNQINPPLPPAPQPQSLGDVAGQGAGSMDSIGAAGAPASMGSAQMAATGAGPSGDTMPSSIGQEHPEVEAAAHAYASGKANLDDALAHAHKYTYRDMPAVKEWATLRGQKTAEDMMNVERERSRRAFDVQTNKNTGNEAVTNIKDKGVDREGRRKTAMMQEQIQAKHEDLKAQLDNDLQRAEIVAKSARARGDQQIPAEFRMLQAEATEAAVNMDKATKKLTSNTAIVDDQFRADAQIEFNKAEKEFNKARAQVHSFNAAYGHVDQPQIGGGTPAPAPAPAPGPAAPVPGGNVAPPAHGIRTEVPVQEPNMSAVPTGPAPVTNSGRPVVAIPDAGALPPRRGGDVGTVQPATPPPTPVLVNGKPVVKPLPDGSLVMKMSNGKAAPYNPQQWAR